MGGRCVLNPHNDGRTSKMTEPQDNPIQIARVVKSERNADGAIMYSVLIESFTES